MRAADEGQSLLELEARLAAVGGAGGRGAGDERAGTVGGVCRVERVVDVDEDDGAAGRGAGGGAEGRDLRAQLVDEGRREDEVVGVGERVCVSLAALQGVGEAQSAGELPEVLRAAELEEESPVVARGEVVVEAGGEGAVAGRSADELDVGGEFGGRVGRRGGRLEAPACEGGRRGEWEERVLLDGDEGA